MLVFSAIVPHSPLLLPSIGKKNQGKLKKTLTAYQKLEEDLYVSKPETIIIFSPHGTSLPEAFSINLAQNYETNLAEFGDFGTKLKFPPDTMLIERLRRHLQEEKDLPVTLCTDQFLDYASTVPAALLTNHLQNVSLIPIYDSGLSLKKHFEFGQALQEEIIKDKKRVAVIASADLSHRLTDKAPGGFSPEGKKFDDAVVACLNEGNVKGILALEKDITEAKACGLKTITMLLGALDKINCSPELLSYEGPFGVGYLVVKFKLP
ncbi:MAG: AmmeMemoRadiSam system protein B [bacterium]|nr:AmmeMemoRadiSam system protein B [bacterium]